MKTSRTETQTVPSLPLTTARSVVEGFVAFHKEFRTITRRAERRFRNCDWEGAQKDAVDRLMLHTRMVLHVVQDFETHGTHELFEREFWVRVRHEHATLCARRADRELAETFFNSVVRRLFPTHSVDARIEYLESTSTHRALRTSDAVFRSFPHQQDLATIILEILTRRHWRFRDLREDADKTARRIEAFLFTHYGHAHFSTIEVVRPPFFRGKGAYLVGRIRLHNGTNLPLVLALTNNTEGISVDAALLDADEVSIVFSFTRSYFHVDAGRHHRVINFLKTIMPHKRIAELYISIGHDKHGKTELYRDLERHLTESSDQFISARGQKGMVMCVFTLPTYDVVFKIIRDHFKPPKITDRERVLAGYRLVFRRDRAGRLIDAQEFEYLRFPASRFAPDVLEEITTEAAQSVQRQGDDVVIRHLYAERKVTPLNVYLKEAPLAHALEVVADFGYAIKDLAYANIFPGDMFLKNFGVTRHRRVVFYDYDELCLLTSCNFRPLPAARYAEEEWEAETPFGVGENDIFPEELERFLGLHGSMREHFLQFHSDLFSVNFWQGVQELHRHGTVLDIFPYTAQARLGKKRRYQLDSAHPTTELA